MLAGKDTGQIPASIETRRGRLGFRLLFFAGTHILTADTPMGRKMRPHIRHGGAPLLRYRRKDLERAGVERVLERVVGVEDGLPMLDGGRILDVRNVVWCTGFRPDFSWIRFPYEIGDDGYPVQYRGAVASSPGLYFAGLPFLHSFASMLIGGAGRDAERVARHIGTVRADELDDGAPATHAGRRGRARGVVTEAVLVWNGLVSRVDEGLIVPSGPLADENCVHVVDAESEGVRNTFARDPWSGSHIEGSDNETGRRDRGVARRRARRPRSTACRSSPPSAEGEARVAAGVRRRGESARSAPCRRPRPRPSRSARAG